MRLQGVAGVACVIVLAGCGGADAPETAESVQVPTAASAPSAGSSFIGRGAFQDAGRVWPLVPSSGSAACARSGSGRLATFTPTGQRAAYWLNGTAKATGQYLDLQAIWAEDPTNPGARLSMQDLTEYALSLCG